MAAAGRLRFQTAVTFWPKGQTPRCLRAAGHRPVEREMVKIWCCHRWEWSQEKKNKLRVKKKITAIFFFWGGGQGRGDLCKTSTPEFVSWTLKRFFGYSQIRGDSADREHAGKAHFPPDRGMSRESPGGSWGNVITKKRVSERASVKERESDPTVQSQV